MTVFNLVGEAVVHFDVIPALWLANWKSRANNRLVHLGLDIQQFHQIHLQ